jgi:hypothetical protein
MIELKDDGIILAAVNARMHAQVFPYASRVSLDGQFLASRSIGFVMFPPLLVPVAGYLTVTRDAVVGAAVLVASVYVIFLKRLEFLAAGAALTLWHMFNFTTPRALPPERHAPS